MNLHPTSLLQLCSKLVKIRIRRVRGASLDILNNKKISVTVILIQVLQLELTSMLFWLSLKGRETCRFAGRTFPVSWNSFKSFWIVRTFTLVCLSMSWTVRFRLWCIWMRTQHRSSDKALYRGMEQIFLSRPLENLNLLVNWAASLRLIHSLY